MACERCEELAEELRQLRELLADDKHAPPAHYRLTNKQAAMYALLHRRAGMVTTYEQLYIATHGIAPSREIEQLSKLYHVHMVHLRQRLAVAGGPLIRSVHGFGYLMDLNHVQPPIEPSKIAERNKPVASDSAPARRRYLHLEKSSGTD